MKKNIIYIAILVIGIMMTACNTRKEILLEDRKIDSENFPDEIFRAYVSENFDTDKNGILSVKEIEDVTEINVEDMDIEKLEGIEFFINLQALFCSSCHLKALDVSYNPKLNSLDCSYNGIKKLDLSYNTELRILECSHNEIEKLDFRYNTELKDLHWRNNHQIAARGYRLSLELWGKLSIQNLYMFWPLLRLCSELQVKRLSYCNCQRYTYHYGHAKQMWHTMI